MIELLLATALAAVLMVAVLQVTASLGRVSKAISPHSQTQQLWQMNLSRLLAQDLAEASQVQVKDRIITLEGPLGFDSASFKRTHQPSRVIYRIDLQDGGVAVLLREQRDLLSQSNRHRQVMLVCSQISAFTLKPAGDATGEKSQQNQNAPAAYQFALVADGNTFTRTISLR